MSDAPPRHARQPLRERGTPPECSAADVSPDGRLVATCDGDGVRLWEADTGRELAHLKAGVCETVLFHPDGQSLISSSRWGLYRWPIRPDPDRGPDAIRVGPPELLRESAGTQWSKATWLPDHGALALIDNANARVLLVDSSRSPPGLEPGNGPRQRRESPHDLGRRQPGWPLAGGRRLVRGRGPGLGPAPAPARAHLETEGCRRRHDLLHRLQPRRPLARFVHAPRCGADFLPLLARGDVGPGSADRPGAQRERLVPAGVHRRRPADGPGDRARPGAAGRRRHRTRACTADDIAAGDPDTARLQPRRHEAGCQHQPKDRAGVGPAADPRPARADGAGLGRAAVSDRLGRERRRLARCPRRGRCGSSAKSSSRRRSAPPNWPR